MSRLLCQLSYTALRAQTRQGARPGKENDTAGQVVPLPAGRCPSPFTESNRRPSPYHGDALPTELKGQSPPAVHDRIRPNPPADSLGNSTPAHRMHENERSWAPRVRADRPPRGSAHQPQHVRGGRG